MPDPAILARFTQATNTLATDARVCFGTASDDLADDFLEALTVMPEAERRFAEAMFRAGVQAAVARLVDRQMVTVADIVEAWT